jgi:hypothetical protein
MRARGVPVRPVYLLTITSTKHGFEVFGCHIPQSIISYAKDFIKLNQEWDPAVISSEVHYVTINAVSKYIIITIFKYNIPWSIKLSLLQGFAIFKKMSIALPQLRSWINLLVILYAELSCEPLVFLYLSGVFFLRIFYKLSILGS